MWKADYEYSHHQYESLSTISYRCGGTYGDGVLSHERTHRVFGSRGPGG
jgi:hypothetical protein